MQFIVYNALTALKNSTYGTIILVTGFSSVMGSILKDLQIQQYIISVTDIGRQQLAEELIEIFQQYTTSNANFFCNSNNTAGSFEAYTETSTLNKWTRLASTPLPQYYGLAVLLADFTSVSWLKSCYNLNFFQYQTNSLQKQIAGNFTNYINSSRVAVIVGSNSSRHCFCLYCVYFVGYFTMANLKSISTMYHYKV